MSCRETEHLRQDRHLRVLMADDARGRVVDHQAGGAWARGGPDETGGRHQLILL